MGIQTTAFCLELGWSCISILLLKIWLPPLLMTMKCKVIAILVPYWSTDKLAEIDDDMLSDLDDVTHWGFVLSSTGTALSLTVFLTARSSTSPNLFWSDIA